MKYIDFSPLEKNRFTKNNRLTILIIVSSIIIAAILIIGPQVIWVFLISWFFYVMLTQLWLLTSYYTPDINKIKAFAKENNFIVSEKTDLGFAPPIYGYDKIKHRIPLVIHGRLFDLDFKYFPYVLLDEKSSIHNERIVLWVILFELKRKLPSFVVDAIYNPSRIPRYFNDFDEVNLEGNFSDYFRVYIPKKDQIDVLSVLTPEVMDKLMEFWEISDIIIADKKVWIVGGGTEKNIKKATEDLFDCAEVILPELAHRAKSYRKY